MSTPQSKRVCKQGAMREIFLFTLSQLHFNSNQQGFKNINVAVAAMTCISQSVALIKPLIMRLLPVK